MAFSLTHVEVKVCHTIEEVIREAVDHQANGSTEAERDYNKYRAAKIHDVLVKGYSTPYYWYTGEVPSTGLRRRVDGQHSSRVFIDLTPEEQSHVIMPIYIFRGLYTCDTNEDLAFLFGQFNQPWSSRRSEDYLGAYMSQRPDLAGMIQKKSADYATKGIQWYLAKVEAYEPKSKHAQYQLVLQNSAIEHFLEFCGSHPGSLNLGSRTKEMSQMPVVAAMFHTLKHGDDSDRAFWRQVAGGRVVNLDIDTHEYKLAEFLECARDRFYEWPAAIRKRFRSEYRPNQVEIFATCLRVFAAYKKHSPIREAFLPVHDQDMISIVRRLYPLPQAS